MARTIALVPSPFMTPEYFCNGLEGHDGTGLVDDVPTACPQCTGELGPNADLYLDDDSGDYDDYREQAYEMAAEAYHESLMFGEG